MKRSAWIDGYFVFAFHARGRGSDSQRRHMSNAYFSSNRPELTHAVYLELKEKWNQDGTYVGVITFVVVTPRNCSVAEVRRW